MAELLWLLLCLLFLAPAVGDGAAESAGGDDEGEAFAFFILSLSAWGRISDPRLLLFIFLLYFLLLSRDGDVC